MNYAWETIFTFIHPPLDASGSVDLFKASLYAVWFVLDTMIVFQLLRYGRKRQVHPFVRANFYPVVIGTFVLSAAGIYLMFVSLGYRHQDEIAFGMNLLMSVLFIFMLWQRPDLNGISRGAAWFKMLGTGLIAAAETMLVAGGLKPAIPIVLFFYATILLFDVLYVRLVSRALAQAARVDAAVGVRLTAQPVGVNP